METDDELFSDESSFYGDEELKAEYEERAASYDPSHFWKMYEGSWLQINSRAVTAIATEEGKRGLVESQPDGKLKAAGNANNTKAAFETDLDTDAADIKPHNPYEGDPTAKQLNESLDTFLSRLRPSNTTFTSGPWIWIANPFASNRYLYRDQARFVDAGNALIEEYMSRKRRLEEQNPTKAPGTTTRMLKADRTWLEDAIVELAKNTSVTNGKWMLFPTPNRVDEMWEKVARGTLEGRLGCVAKVATDDGGERPERLICIYVHDFSDRREVKRVLYELRRLRLVSDEGDAKPIYFKTDAYTYLNIASGNEYKLKASLYNSRDMFEE